MIQSELVDREERRRRYKESQGRGKTWERRRLWLVWAAGLTVILAGNGLLFMLPSIFPEPRVELGRAVEEEGRGHVALGTEITYRNVPPSSGPHYPRWAAYGVYEDVTITERSWVHNLEHGAIVILYRRAEGESSCPELARQLRALYEQAPPGKYGKVKMVVTQYPGLATPLAALAWGRIDELPAFDRDRLLSFYRTYVDRGPEDAP